MAESEGISWRAVEIMADAILGALDDRHAGRIPWGTAGNDIEFRAYRIREIARALRGQVTRGLHTNPALVVYGNPPRGGELMSRRVYAVEYQHAADKQDYRHDCARGVSLYALGDGTLLLQRPDRKSLSRAFDV